MSVHIEHLHTIDPDGDVVLTLHNPNPPFAFWDGCEDAGIQWLNLWHSGPQPLIVKPSSSGPRRLSFNSKGFWDSVSSVRMKDLKKKKNKKEKKEERKNKKLEKLQQSTPDVSVEPAVELAPHPPPTEETTATPTAAPTLPPSWDASEKTSGGASLILDAAAGSTTESRNETRVESPTPVVRDVRFLVSSRHLSLASSQFKAQLNGGWEEASIHPNDGRRHLKTSDWDADAFLILMRIFHARTNKVPRRIDLEMLAKVAVLVDYYDCHDAVEFFSTMWIDALKKQLPSQCNRELVLWLLISVVFQQGDIFTRITKTAVNESKGPIPVLGLPISQHLIDVIDWRRQDAIVAIWNVLNDLRSSLLQGSVGCDFDCSSSLFGALTKNMVHHRFLDPAPCEPYLGYGLAAVEKVINDFRSPSWEHTTYNKCQLSRMITDRLYPGLDQTKEGFSLSEIGLLRR